MPGSGSSESHGSLGCRTDFAIICRILEQLGPTDCFRVRSTTVEVLMRNRLIAAASVLMLIGAPVLAQTAPPSSAPRTPSPSSSMSAQAQAVRTPVPDPLKMEDVSKITGSAVYGSDDSKIGSISTILMKPEDK